MSRSPNLHAPRPKPAHARSSILNRSHLSLLQLGTLAVLAGLLSIVLQASADTVWFQSPISPLTPAVSPVAPEQEGSEPPPSLVSERGTPLPRMFAQNVLSSPWPWVGIGVVVFGALAWGSVVLLGRMGRDE